MKLFGFEIGKEKPMPFPEFRDYVRLITRRSLSTVQFENREYGFVLKLHGKPPTPCNLRRLYEDYIKCPAGKEHLVERWIRSLTVEIPEHSWTEAQATLRPILKHTGYVAHAQALMMKNNPPDSLPFAPFAGDLRVIIMRELPGTVVAVTQRTLELWNVSFEQAMRQALDNLNMCSFPTLNSALLAGGNQKEDSPKEEIGLIFEGDHLTASWLIIARFRDYLSQRLQGDFITHVPTRNRLTAIRTDEPAMLSQIQARNRNYAGHLPWLTSQGFHVSGTATGGIVSVHKVS